MIKVKEYDAILQRLDVCTYDGDIGQAIEAEGLPEDLADALLLYAEYQDNRKHWPDLDGQSIRKDVFK